jgi:hypothetical protein
VGRAVFGPLTSSLYKGAMVPHPPRFVFHLQHLQSRCAPALRAPRVVARRQAQVLRRNSAGNILQRLGSLFLPYSRSAFLLLLRGVLPPTTCAAAHRRRPPLRRSSRLRFQGDLRCPSQVSTPRSDLLLFFLFFTGSVVYLPHLYFLFLLCVDLLGLVDQGKTVRR